MSELAAQIETFRRHLAHEKRASPRTVATYTRDLAELRAFLEEKRLADDARRVDATSLRRYLASVVRDREPATMARKISALRSFFRFLVSRRIVRENPAAGLKPPRIAKSAPRFLTVDEALRVVEAHGDDGPCRALHAP